MPLEGPILDSYDDTPVCDSEGLLKRPPKLNQLTIDRWKLNPEKFSIQRVELASLGKYRNPRNGQKVDSLRKAMREKKPIPPIYLKTNRPYINNGNHRVEAARAEGFKFIWAVVEDTGPLGSSFHTLPKSLR